MNNRIKIKNSSVKFYSNTASIPKEDREELVYQLKKYKKEVDDLFQEMITHVEKGVDVSWDYITDELSTKLESIADGIKVYEPNECNDRGW